MERNKDKKEDSPDEEFYMGYGINTPGSGGAKIYNIVEYADESTETHSTVDFYCVKAGVGFTDMANNVKNNRQRYNVSYNMKTERGEIAQHPSTNDVFKGLVEDKTIPDGKSGNVKRYDALLAALDMLYIPGKSTEAEKQNLKNNIISQAMKEDDASAIQKIMDIKSDKYPLTDNDIVAVQQAAIWYFTNYEEEDNKYDHTAEGENESWLTYSSNGGESYDALSNYRLNTDNDEMGNTRGQLRAFQAHMLYKYIIEQAKANANKYTSAAATTSAPATVTTPSVSQNKGTLGYEISDGNYLIGPIHITENTANALPYTIDFTVKVNDLPNESYTILKNKTDQVDSIKETLGEDFYISIPKSDVNTVSINVKFNYRNTDMILWASTEIPNEQPLVELKETSLSSEVNLTATPKEPEKKFDLALRKYITKINGTAIENTRNPDIDESTLTSPDGTTATYKHRKDPLIVCSGDKVTYNITIYNEGEKNGYATKIVDQLPAGLKLVENSIIGNYEIDPAHPYDESTNIVYLRRKDGVEESLQAYSGSGDPKSESVEITCEITAKPDQNNSKILTNIAWISEAFDAEAEGGGAITDSDIDSQTSNSPSVSNDNMPNYKGHAENPEPVPPVDGNIPYFKGEQDDDDFEKVKMLPEAFDLKLIKYISAVNDEPEPKRIEKVDVSNLNRTDESGNMTGHTAKYTMNKDPITVKLGDIVTYTIRVYNEGTIDGYAQKIVEDIPEGLELIWSDKRGEELENDQDLTSEEKEAIVFNQDYLWGDFEYNEQRDRIIRISSTYLSKENETTLNPTLIKAFGKNDGTKEEKDISYRDIAIKLRVISTNIKSIIRNEAAISEHIDKNGNDITDRDSHPGKDEDTWTKQNSDEFYKDDNKWPVYEEDDEDYDNLIVESFDLALRKFIVEVSEDSEVDEGEFSYERQPSVNTSKLNTLDEEGNVISTATYEHSKEPVEVKKNDYIVYMLRVYNEGSLDGYAGEIKDHLPEYLEFVDGEFNKKYNWSVSEDGRTVTTDYLANQLIKKAELNEPVTNEAEKYKLYFKDVPIMCRLKDTVKVNQNVTNIADITKYEDEKHKPAKDRDSVEDNLEKPEDKDLPEYNEHQEDDDDFEKVVVKKFDLALRKFITKVNEENVDTRVPKPTKQENGQIKYEHSKEPVEVAQGDIVTYTIRVYNEGKIDGYASEIADDIPDGLEFLPQNATNIEYRWVMYDANGEKTNDAQNAEKVVTDYLSKAQGEARKGDVEGENPALLKAFNSDEGITETNPDYKDVKIAFKIVEPNSSDRILVNSAQITDDTDKNGSPIDDEDSKPDEWNDGEDDQDQEFVKLKEFDLALRKFITKVNEENVDTRVPQPTKQENGQIKYEHSKEPVEVAQGDIVTYTIRVYNEGKIDGYASEIADDIPDGLEFLPQNATNIEYRWVMYDANGEKTNDAQNAEKVVTDYLSKAQGEARKGDVEGENPALLKAFNSDEGITETNPDYKDVKIAFKIVEPNSSDRILVNSAQITDDTDKNGSPIDDEDSKPDEWNDGEDDQDQEFVKLKEFDLALRKFITKVNEENVDTRVPQPTKQENGQIKYEHSKEPVGVVQGDIVTYTIRVYNEGKIDGYASEISDDIPDGLEFLPQNATNIEYRWIMYDANGKETKNVQNAKTVVTDYLSKDQGEARMGDDEGENPALLKAFNAEGDITETNPDYKDVKIAFRIVEPNSSNKILVNSAQITDDTDKDGNPVEDKDSTPDEWNDGEDDQDQEFVELKEFDLSLRKWVTQAIVIENGKETVTQTGHQPYDDPEGVVKVEIHRKKLDKVTVKFRYSIRVTNEGDIAGYAKEITDYIPNGLKFVAADNPNWTDEGNNIISTRQLENTLLQPGEHAEVQVLLTWVNNQNNMGVMDNTAEISEDYNDKGVPDRDSTPDNKKDREDDIDDAPVMLTIGTGKGATYFALGFIVLVTIAGGIILIKKRVL